MGNEQSTTQAAAPPPLMSTTSITKEADLFKNFLSCMCGDRPMPRLRATEPVRFSEHSMHVWAQEFKLGSATRGGFQFECTPVLDGPGKVNVNAVSWGLSRKATLVVWTPWERQDDATAMQTFVQDCFKMDAGAIATPCERTFAPGKQKGLRFRGNSKAGTVEAYAVRFKGMSIIQRVYVGLQAHHGANMEEVDNLFEEFAASLQPR